MIYVQRKSKIATNKDVMESVKFVKMEMLKLREYALLEFYIATNKTMTENVLNASITIH